MEPEHILRRTQGFPAVDGVAAGQQGAARRAVLEPRQPDVEPRRVGEIGAEADQDHVGAGALEMDVGAGVLAGDPFRFARRKRDLAVDRQRQLERDARAAEAQAGQPAGERSRGGVGDEADLDLDPGGAEPRDALAVGPRIGVLAGDDDTGGPAAINRSAQAGPRSLTWAQGSSVT